MNKDIIQGKWEEVKGQVKQQWGKLTDDDITTMQGSSQELCGKLQQRYGYEKDRAEQEINDFVKKNHLNDE